MTTGIEVLCVFRSVLLQTSKAQVVAVCALRGAAAVLLLTLLP